MNVKIDTKEKFNVLTPNILPFSANMTADIEFLGQYGTKLVPHIVINLKDIELLTNDYAHALAALQQQFYERNQSCVVCEMKPEVEAIFEKEELTDLMNITPTESEAWDIIQMEEIERELMADFDEEENKV